MISTLCYQIVNALTALGNIPQGWAIDVLPACTGIALYTLTPRFVMNIRELYAVDIQGRCGGDIDTGFGLSSRAGRSVGGMTTIGTIAFAGGGGIGGSDDGEQAATGEERAQNGNRQVSAA